VTDPDPETGPWLPRLDEDWERALAVVAHPDDLEYGVAGAVARWTAQGKWVGYVLVTSGEAGIDSIPPDRCAVLRQEEQRRSAAVVGVTTVEFLAHPDGLVEEGPLLRRDLAAAIRRHRPDVVISINHRETFGGPERNHADHRAVGSALLDAVRDAANRWLFVGAGGAPWKGVRFVAFGGSPVPTHGVDVTGSLDLAVASLREHAVYLAELDEGTVGKEPDPFLRGLAAAAGEALGVEAATLFEVVPF
jgi:LmbE family N-acetylglucosaminyl deacetylase